MPSKEPRQRGPRRRRPRAAPRPGVDRPADPIPVPGPSGRAPSLPIVGIGSSAGGLQALQDFLSRMPADSGVALVIVTHQHAGRVSLLPELLARSTAMPVRPAAEGVAVEPNCVYVAVPDGQLEVADGVLHRVEDTSAPGFHRPIDHFLRSLAADRAEHAICVILSGAGSDGTLGVQAVKAAGGLVLVQEPTSAQYAGMPASAAGTGLADYVLRPADLPGKLVAYVRGPFLRPPPPVGAPPPLPEAAIARILVELRQRTGHDFTGYKHGTLSRRIERRMHLHHLAEPEAYRHYLHENAHEAPLLLRELLIGVTSFFRDPEAFRALAEKALPQLLASRDAEAPLRVWVAGCATGEEAYSVAILLHECSQETHPPFGLQLFGTDLDERAVAMARLGRYPEGISADVTPARLERCFTPEDGGFRVCQEVREGLVFAVHDLLKDAPFTKLDLLVCRNVLIYLGAEAQQRLLPLFHYALRPGGVLFLGGSEGVAGLEQWFDAIDGTWRIHRRKAVAPVPPVALRLLVQAQRGPAGEAGRPASPAAEPVGLGAQVQRLLLTRFAPPCVLVDAQGTLVYVAGRTGLYLELSLGRPPHNLVDLAREGLGPVLAAALRQAQDGAQEVVRRQVRVRTNHEFTWVDVAVSPVTQPGALRGLFLVSFQPGQEPASVRRDEPPHPTGAPSAREEELRLELQDSRDAHQSLVEALETANEELRSGNEELQSTNEELQSANEELETSREELQSLNEELSTVNAELEAKVEALALSRDDLHNLLNSTQVACIFLDEQLRVQRYTEPAKDVIRLIDSDVGRPLSDLAANLEDGGLQADCRTVLDTLMPQEREVRDRDGHWYLLRVLPYRTVGNAIGGVVVTLVSIDRVKTAEAAEAGAATARDFFVSIVQTVREPLLVLDTDLQVVEANSAYHRSFGTRPAQVVGRPLYALGEGQWDLPALRERLGRVLAADTAFEDLAVDVRSAEGGHRPFMFNARRLARAVGLPTLILLAMEEVREERK